MDGLVKNRAKGSGQLTVAERGTTATGRGTGNSNGSETIIIWSWVGQVKEQTLRGSGQLTQRGFGNSGPREIIFGQRRQGINWHLS